MSSATKQRHVYLIYDGGEQWWYAAHSGADAIMQHLRLNYLNAGVEPEQSLDWYWSQMPDDAELPIRDADRTGGTITRTARRWAAKHSGLLGTTCC